MKIKYWGEALADPQHDMDRAVETARQSIPSMKLVRKEKDWCGFTIVRDGNQFRVYTDDAWQQPFEKPMLAWSAPTGAPVGHVDLDGTVTILGDES